MRDRISINYPDPHNDSLVAEFTSFPSGCEENVVVSRASLYPIDTLRIVSDEVLIRARIASSADVMRLLLLTDALRRLNAQHIDLFIPYLPYARQDRVCHQGEALSAKVFADLINSQGYRSVMAVDPHSNVMPALINNFIGISVFGHVSRAINDRGDDATRKCVLVAPDAGATKRVETTASAIGFKGAVTQAMKVRSENGVSVRLMNETDALQRDAIIVDDICDGGATFIALADALNTAGASSVSLCVTHGLFTKGIKHLFDNGIGRIYATNSWRYTPTAEELSLFSNTFKIHFISI